MKWVYPAYRWIMPGNEKKIYLSFDDGPHPVATPFVLDELKKYGAKATFFCIGKNVVEHPAIYKRILEEGHAVGNHTYKHLNGWQTPDAEYFDDIKQAAIYIDSNLFRPPYGRITRFQAKQVQEKMGLHIIMWSVLSGDFDERITPETCWKNVSKSGKNGSIILFHDSEKANLRMSFALPKLLETGVAQGFKFEKISI